MKIIAINAHTQDIDALKAFFGAVELHKTPTVYILILLDTTQQNTAQFQYEIELPTHLTIRQVDNYTRLQSNSVYLLHDQQNFVIKQDALVHYVSWNSQQDAQKAAFWGTLGRYHQENAIGIAMQPTIEHTTGLEQLVDVGGTVMLNAQSANGLQPLNIPVVDFDYIEPAHQLPAYIAQSRHVPQETWDIPEQTNDYDLSATPDLSSSDTWSSYQSATAPPTKRRTFINHALQNYLPSLIYLNAQGQILDFMGNVARFFPAIQKWQNIATVLQSSTDTQHLSDALINLLNQQEASQTVVEASHCEGSSHKLYISLSFVNDLVPNEIIRVVEIKQQHPNKTTTQHPYSSIMAFPERANINGAAAAKPTPNNQPSQALVLSDLDDLDKSYRTSIRELGTLNDDFNNVLQSTDMSIVFVDAALRIRRFTNSVKQHFDISNQFLGQSITDVPMLFTYDGHDFAAIVHKVISEETPVKLEVKNQEDWFSMCIHPYLTTENEVHGGMIKFEKISEVRNIKKRLNDLSGALQQQGVDLIKTKVRLQKVANELSQKNNILEAVLKAMPDAISRLNHEGQYIDYMPAQNEGQIPVAAFVGNKLEDIVPFSAINEVLFAFKQTLALGETQVATFKHYKHNIPQFYEARFALIEQFNEVLCIIRNITEQTVARDALRKTINYYRSLMDNAIVPLLTLRLNGTIIDLNKAALSMLNVADKAAFVHQNISSFLRKKSEMYVVKDLLKRAETDKLPEAARTFTVKNVNGDLIDLIVKGSAFELDGEIIIQLSLQRASAK